MTVSDGNSQILLTTAGLPMQSRSSLQFPAEEFFLARSHPYASGVHPSSNILSHLCNLPVPLVAPKLSAKADEICG
jgi:hypothetical protein